MILHRLVTGRIDIAPPPIAGGHTALLPTATYLMVPGLGNSSRGHWQTHWERELGGSSRVEVDDWDAPSRRHWVAAVDRAVGNAVAPVVLVGHSLGCLAIAAWAAEAPLSLTGRVAAALLVAPPDVGQQGVDLRLMRFGPAPTTPLPFASLVVASANDRYCSLARARALADAWRAGCVDIGRQGHINAESGLGDWQLGLALLADIVRRAGTGAAYYG